MIPIKKSLLANLPDCNLSLPAGFDRDVLELSLAARFTSRRCACRLRLHREVTIGLWEANCGPERNELQTAFRLGIVDLLGAGSDLLQAGTVPLRLDRKPASEPIVLCWMPAAAIYFLDHGGLNPEFPPTRPYKPRHESRMVNWKDGTIRTIATNSLTSVHEQTGD